MSENQEWIMAHYRQRHQAIRAALENLVADGTTGRPSAAYLAACSSLNGHCEECGAQLIRTDAALADALEPVQHGTTDVPGNDQLPICPACFARRRQAAGKRTVLIQEAILHRQGRR
jgi:hypothetical protein